MLINSPPGSLGLASKSGWMTAEIFPEVIKHFIKHTCTTVENPTLLIMDNYQSHISIQVIDLAKNNGIRIVTLPPHCNAKLQPLDVSCHGAFKVYYAAAVDSWNKSNPGKVFSIYNIAGCVNVAHQKAMTPSTIISGFSKSGINPFNRHVFTETDFLSSSVTDRPFPEATVGGSSNQEITSVSDTPAVSNGTDKSGKPFQSPADFKGYPKAAPRKRETDRSMIVTDTPEKVRIIEKKIAATAKNKKVTTGAIRKLFNG